MLEEDVEKDIEILVYKLIYNIIDKSKYIKDGKSDNYIYGYILGVLDTSNQLLSYIDVECEHINKFIKDLDGIEKDIEIVDNLLEKLKTKMLIKISLTKNRELFKELSKL